MVYLTAPAARPVVLRAADALPGPLAPRIVVRDLPTRGRAVSLWSWLKLTAALWLLGKALWAWRICAIRHPWPPVLAVPYTSFGRHAVIIGSSGSGKTNLMMRLWAGWYAAAHTAHLRREGNRPLLVVLDCKGGPDARPKAGRTRRLLHGTGARRVALWPDEARLCLWNRPPRDLGVCCWR